MRILQINCVYGVGSTGKIVKDIHDGLMCSDIESYVLYGRGSLTKDRNVIKCCTEKYSKINNLLTRIHGYLYGGCFFSTKRVIQLINKIKPDIVHLQCINGYFVNIYRLVEWMKNNKIKAVLTLHAEFMYTGNCGHALDCQKWKTGCGQCPRRYKETKSILLDRTHQSWEKMKKAFDKYDDLVLVAVSDWIKNRAAQSPITKDLKTITIYNGIAVDTFTPHNNEADNYIYEKYRLPKSKKIVLHVTPGFDIQIKGGRYFLELVDSLGDNYHAVVVGTDVQTNRNNMTTIPFIANQQELAAFYRAASVLVITSVADNYPTVCIEANCCGTPVVGFDVGGVSETIGDEMGEVVPFANIAELKEKVEKWAERSISDERIKERRSYCHSRRMVQEYINLYEDMI